MFEQIGYVASKNLLKTERNALQYFKKKPKEFFFIKKNQENKRIGNDKDFTMGKGYHMHSILILL